jgi:DNA-binding SARP family transcriptional activator
MPHGWSPEAKQKLAEYGQRPTVFTPPHEKVSPTVRQRLLSGARAVRSATAILLFLAGPPIALWTLTGDPVDRLPSWSEVGDWLNQIDGRLTGAMLYDIAIGAVWLLWAVLALLLLAEVFAALTHVRIPLLRLPAPLHRLVFGLAGTAALTLTSVARPDTASTASAPVRSATTTVVPQQAVAQGPATIRVGTTTYVYVVERGDTLSKVAKAWLGDADRWPEICRMNQHRHWPKVGGVLHDCNLIYPGWDLRLPEDATPPTRATPVPVPRPSDQPITAPSQPDDPDGVIEPRATPPAPSTSPTNTPSTGAPTSSPTTTVQPVTSPTTDATSLPTASSGQGSPDTEATHEPLTDDDGVHLPGAGFVPWALAVAITAAAALVWLQRRRRYVPNDEWDDGGPPELRPLVNELQRQVVRRPELTLHTDLAERAAAVPPLPLFLAGGIGLLGGGAHAAARAALISMLASGGPQDPDHRGEVIIDSTTLTILIGTGAANLGPGLRLHVADDLDGALTAIETRLLHRSRVLDEHALTDLDMLRQHAPDEEALPPIMLVCETPPAGARMRAKVALALGTDLQVSALLLGEWAHGATIEVSPDGHTRLASGQPSEPVPPRLPVLEPDAAVQILTTLREAQTGKPPVLASPALPVTPVPLHASRTATPAEEVPTPPAVTTPEPDSGPARLRVLGPPRIEDVTGPGRPLRAKALELAVFLACHPDGVATREIGEYLEPDARISQADQRVHTNASNLRHVLARAGGVKNGYVVKSAGRYRLDPATVDVDVWQLRDVLRSATIATGPRRRGLLTTACDLYTAPLAEGQDYEWLQPHREMVRRWGTEAHLLLADDLLDSNPQAASDLLDKAIGLDRYNEALYTKAMHARHALGDADGIRTLLRALTKALADLDAEPQEDTITLATQLRNSLDEK